jgi:hypothetical protein
MMKRLGLDSGGDRDCDYDGKTTGRESFKHLTYSDALAIAAYRKSLPAIKNKVPGPFGREREVDVVCLSGVAAG